MAEPPLHFPIEEAERLEPHLPPRLVSSSSPTLPDTTASAPAVALPSTAEVAEGGRGVGEGVGERGTGSSSPLLLPFVTLTFATSLDSMLAHGAGIRTALSGPRSKAMTHYLRSRHDAICVGVGTAIADDPGLNCRLAATDATAPDSNARGDASLGAHAGAGVGVGAGAGAGVGLGPGPSPGVGVGGSSNNNHNATTPMSATPPQQPRPIIVDPRLRWDFTAESKVLRLARAGKGLAPYIVTLVRDPPDHKRQILEALGGKYIILDSCGVNPGSGSGKDTDSDAEYYQGESTDKGRDKGDNTGSSSSRSHHSRFDWRDLLSAIRREGLRSVMVEGGGQVINSFLGENASLVDSIIVTIAPTWLGQGGVTVSPPRRGGHDKPVARLTDTMWMPLGEDVVLCGRVAR
jgi:2,5-diamino-6-(ribosylamino)-4(3H)-pyrimidinone 5'-phosphate reductase